MLMPAGRTGGGVCDFSRFEHVSRTHKHNNTRSCGVTLTSLLCLRVAAVKCVCFTLIWMTNWKDICFFGTYARTVCLQTLAGSSLFVSMQCKQQINQTMCVDSTLAGPSIKPVGGACALCNDTGCARKHLCLALTTLGCIPAGTYNVLPWNWIK
jgi:hypothetical protein